MEPEFDIFRLTPDYTFKEFTSGDEDLDNFLLNDAKTALEDLSAVTYIFESNNEIIAYCSLLNDKISKQDVSNGIWKKIKKKFQATYSSYPAVKIGRLAVNKSVQGSGFGTKLLDFLTFFFIEKNKTGCRFITVDAYDQSLHFYEKYGFIYFSNDDKGKDTRQMYFDLLSVKEA